MNEMTLFRKGTSQGNTFLTGIMRQIYHRVPPFRVVAAARPLVSASFSVTPPLIMPIRSQNRPTKYFPCQKWGE